MPLVIETQIQLVLYAFISGIIVGIIFDIYRLIQGESVPKCIVIIEDILFWILSSIVVFIFLLYESSTFNVYVYVFIIIGTMIYIKFISPYIIKLLFEIKEKIKKIFRIIGKQIIYLLKFSIKMVKKR